MKSTICLLLALVLSVSLLGCSNSEAHAITEVPKEESPVNIFENSMQKSDPAEDDVFNLLLVGSSAFYYQVEEIQGMFTAAGVKAQVYDLYYNGCTLKQQYDWWKAETPNYRLTVIDVDGNKTVTENVDLMYGLRQQNWDAIGLCAGSVASIRTITADAFLESRDSYFSELLGMYRKEFPATTLYWQQHNAYQVGFTSEAFSTLTPEDQVADATAYRNISKAVSAKYEMDWIPRGDAGQIARKNPVVGDTLCARLNVNGNLGDNAHEGDIGGGQYLTACCWFEILLGQSCIGNTYRPDYELSEEKIAALQQAAHEAVENRNN